LSQKEEKEEDDGPKAINAKKFIEHVLPYTERHSARLNRMAQQIMFIDYLWHNMKLNDDQNLKEIDS
jgi:hypothetical protein